MGNTFVESCIAERHNYARHIFTSAVGWFTFFVTVNYASMGWLAGAADKFKGNHATIVLIASLFSTQNLLGIIACLFIRSYFFRCNSRILQGQALLLRAEAIAEDQGDLSGQTCLPLRLYSTLIILMIVALAPILAAWIIFPLVYPQ
jgi:hypothetical protein